MYLEREGKGMTDRLQEFINWVRQGNRNVQIDIGQPYNNTYLSIWVFDFDLKAGQHVNSVEEIDLEKKSADKERIEYLRLKKKFEGEKE